MTTTNTNTMQNAIQTAAANQAAAARGKKPSIQALIKEMSDRGEIARALPSVITPERFTRIALSAVSANPKLAQCSAVTLLGAMMTSAQLGLEPNTPLGQAYLIPYRNKGVLECQFQLGYKGLIDLAYRSGRVQTIMAQIVYENDTFEYSYGIDCTLKHVPARGARGNATYVYAVLKTKDGGYAYDVMSIEDVRAHAKKFSKSYGSGPWQTNFEEMAKKTVLKKVLKYAPLSSDFVRAVASDETIKSQIGEDMYAVPNEMAYEDGDALDGEIIDAETGELIPAATQEGQGA